LEKLSILGNHDVCESTENLHLKVLEDARRSGKGVAFRCLFLFSSNFLGGAERKVTLKGISTFYRLYTCLAQLLNEISSRPSATMNQRDNDYYHF